MLNTFIKTAVAAAVLLSALPAQAWEKDKRQKYRQVYQNVTAEDLPKLIAGSVWVNYVPDSDQLGATIFTKDGTKVICGTLDGLTTKLSWKSIMIEFARKRERYPLLENTGPDGIVGFTLLKYVPETGGFYGYIAQRPYWWETVVGHLQTEIPAAVYTACPDFPSAKSLGLKVNTKQTSVKYHEMIKQDPGNRIKRPDLVTEVTVEKY